MNAGVKITVSLHCTVQYGKHWPHKAEFTWTKTNDIRSGASRPQEHISSAQQPQVAEAPHLTAQTDLPHRRKSSPLATQIMYDKVSAQNLRKENQRIGTVQRTRRDLGMTLSTQGFDLHLRSLQWLNRLYAVPIPNQIALCPHVLFLPLPGNRNDYFLVDTGHLSMQLTPSLAAKCHLLNEACADH